MCLPLFAARASERNCSRVAEMENARWSVVRNSSTGMPQSAWTRLYKNGRFCCGIGLMIVPVLSKWRMLPFLDFEAFTNSRSCLSVNSVTWNGTKERLCTYPLTLVLSAGNDAFQAYNAMATSIVTSPLNCFLRAASNAACLRTSGVWQWLMLPESTIICKLVENTAWISIQYFFATHVGGSTNVYEIYVILNPLTVLTYSLHRNLLEPCQDKFCCVILLSLLTIFS